MCDYCYEDETINEKDFAGMDGIFHDTKNGKYYLVAEHFRNERVKIEVKYCPPVWKEVS